MRLASTAIFEDEKKKNAIFWFCFALLRLWFKEKRERKGDEELKRGEPRACKIREGGSVGEVSMNGICRFI